MKKLMTRLFLTMLTSTIFAPMGLTQSHATRCVIPDLSTDKIGYTMTDSRIAQLIKNRWLPATKELTDAEINSRIQRFIARHNGQADINLSYSIINVSRATGIDPFIFTSLIKAESTFKPEAISHTGALGLTQMTQIAFSELRNQIGVGDRRFTPRASEHFINMIYNYFENRESTQRYVDFVASTRISRNNRKVLRNLDYSLVSGALLFKLKLALVNGDVRRALEAYNGSPDRVPYARRILNSTRNGFTPVSLTCLNIDYSNPIIGDSCELSQDSEFCRQYLGIITL